MTMRFNPAAWQRLLASGSAAPLEPLYVDDGDGHPNRWVDPHVVFTATVPSAPPDYIPSADPLAPPPPGGGRVPHKDAARSGPAGPPLP